MRFTAAKKPRVIRYYFEYILRYLVAMASRRSFTEMELSMTMRNWSSLVFTRNLILAVGILVISKDPQGKRDQEKEEKE